MNFKMAMAGLTMALICGSAFGIEDGPYSEVAKKAIKPENLRNLAARINDAQLALGLSFLSQSVEVQQELSAKAIKLDPSLAPAAAVQRVLQSRDDERAIGELVQQDPSNALGYYLLGTAKHVQKQNAEALEAFRKGASCTQLRIYDVETWDALQKALDALQLQGQDRLAVAAWRAIAFQSVSGTNIADAMYETGRETNGEELSEMLLVLAGHLSQSEPHFSAYRNALVLSFRIKAELADARKQPTVNGYVAIVRALLSVYDAYPEIEGERHSAVEVARNLPWSVREALAVTNPAASTDMLPWGNFVVPEIDKRVFEEAKEVAIKKGEDFLKAVLPVSEKIMEAYYKRSVPSDHTNQGPWVARVTYLQKAISKHPDVFRACGEFQESLQAVSEAAKNDLNRQNMSRIFHLNSRMHTLLEHTNDQYPANVNVLIEGGYIKGMQEATSVLSNKPYIYTAAGEQVPQTSVECNSFVVFYDDTPVFGDNYLAAFADGHAGIVPIKQVQENLKSRRK